MAFTKRHYEAVARIIREQRDIANTPALRPDFRQGSHCAITDIQDHLRRMFAADNPRFDGTRFDMACEPKDGGAR